MDTVETELLPLTEMIEKMFPQGYVDYLKKKHGNIRNYYESSTPTTQCNNTVGPVVRNETDCWICGFKIPETPGPEHGFAPECEHIFPIAQALFFIGLYTNDVKSNEEYKEKLKLEYDWAHRVCNQIKNDSHFIVHNNLKPDGRWSIDRVKIGEFLADILTRGNKYGKGANLLKQQIANDGKTIADWAKLRTEVIYKKCDDILKTIQPKDENFWVLATVSDLAYSYQTSGFVPEAIPPYVPIVAPGGTVARYNPETATQIYSSWADYIMTFIQQFTTAYLAEKIRRYTPEEKAQRAQKVIYMNDKSLIANAGRFVWNIYNGIPDNSNKEVRFVEAIQYMITSVLLERLRRIFTADTDIASPALKKLGAEMRRNLDTIKEVWNANNLGDRIQGLDNIVSTDLKGAARRSRC